MNYNRDNLLKFIADVEDSHFRTTEDTGANPNALMIWGMVRQFAGLKRLALEDLPQWCVTCRKYHVNPHKKNDSHKNNT